jgi:hypothetical protein
MLKDTLNHTSLSDKAMPAITEFSKNMFALTKLAHNEGFFWAWICSKIALLEFKNSLKYAI